MLVGGLACVAVLLAYNTLAFGSPFHLGYESEQGFDELKTGFFGITYPSWWKWREILIGSYRGLLPLSPLVALTPIGLALLARAPARRRPAFVAAAIAAFYFLLNASYYYWEGGWAYAPRQLTPALPFLASAHRLTKMYAPSCASRKDNISKSHGGDEERKARQKIMRKK